jgi:hypothetical protein
LLKEHISAMAQSEETYQYPKSNRTCSFRPILNTDRLTLTIWDLENEEDNDFALAFHSDPATVGVLGRPMFQTVEQIVAYRRSTTLLAEHTPQKLPVCLLKFRSRS